MSKVDVSGSLLEISAPYQILVFGDFDYLEDFEVKTRFYNPKNYDDIRPHKYSYRVWFQSMSLRYFFEMALFCTCVLIFQMFISQFNFDLHYLRDDLTELEGYGIFTRDEAGHIIATESARILASTDSY